jgi:RimJ/RimL family protein N-acetyltransferase
MESIIIRPPQPERDFAEIALLICNEEYEITTAAALGQDYEDHKDQTIYFGVAESEGRDLVGFGWAWASKLIAGLATFYLVIKPEYRGGGFGRLLYADMTSAIQKANLEKLRTRVLDTSLTSRAFVERRGFEEERHNFEMVLNLGGFDDQPYEVILTRLKAEGICFTSMEELGNTDEAQRKLYDLNNSTGITTPGAGGEPAWTSCVDFQKSVCQSDWYKPAGQIIAIDSATGRWAAMSAITRFEGFDYAYNLFTGVDIPYRGRKLGQAVKVLALRYARQILQVDSVHTHHNTKNQPMIAIDRKFGYQQKRGTFLMEKTL